MICKCGHLQSDHCPQKWAGIHSCTTTECNAQSLEHNSLMCACLKFRPDNLMYVEHLAKEKNLL